MRLQSAENGFMEPTGHRLHHGNRYPNSPWDEGNELEERTYDLCESSSEDEGEEKQIQRANMVSQRMSSYGSIQRPKYRQSTYRIAPNRNPKHSISTSRAVAGLERGTHNTIDDHHHTLAANSFAAEKVQQQTLSSFERFENARKQRTAIRSRRQAACAKARKVKERSLRDSVAAQKCLVAYVPTSNLQVLLERSGAPRCFVDFTCCPSGRHKLVKQTKREVKGLMKNWEGESLSLAAGDAYVVVGKGEQSLWCD